MRKKGGNPTRAKRMTRYVEPHTSHVAARHVNTNGDSGRGDIVSVELLIGS
jgi:hypothetical protein